MTVNEYRLDELARISGISARNIRAYREKRLLDPPRRRGRSAWYDDHHLAQLDTINDLLGRGFTSAHIVEFFDTVRAGGSITELLGLARAIPCGEPGSADRGGVRVAIDPDGPDGARLVDLGLALRSGTALTFTDVTIGRAMASAPDPVLYARLVLALVDAGGPGVESLAESVIAVLEGANAPHPGSEGSDPGERIVEHAPLGHAVLADQLRRALLTRAAPADSDDAEGSEH